VCTAVVRGYRPNGTVTWYTYGYGSFSFANDISTCSLQNGRCSITMTATAAGEAVIQANYGGDPGNLPSSETHTLTVRQARTTLSVSCTPSSVAVGSSTTCTATLNGYFGTVSGETVSWSHVSGKGSVTFPSPATCTLSSTGTCSVILTGETVGRVAIGATYSGDTNNVGSSKTTSIGITRQ
jgi:hypothetical protein